MSFLIVANPSSGSADDGLAERAARRLAGADVVTLSPDLDLAGAVRSATSAGAVVVAAGGDGTVHAVLQHLVGGGTLGVLPAGTLNHFARDLGLRDEDTALAALEAGVTRDVDVGALQDRYFVNNVVLGLYPEIVRQRERSEDRLGKWRAAAAAAVGALRTARTLTGTVDAGGDVRVLDAWMLLVGNNRYDMRTGGGRAALDEGVLDVHLLRRGPRSRIALGIAQGRPWGRRHVRTQAATVSVSLREPRRMAVDGELGDPVDAIRCEIKPAALRVVAPVEDA